MAVSAPPVPQTIYDPFARLATGGSGAIAAPYILAPAPSGGDDYATLQALFDFYHPLGIRVVLRKGAYLTWQELQILTAAAMTDGAGIDYNTTQTVIRAMAPMRSVIFCQFGTGKLSNLEADANQMATDAILVRGVTLGGFENVSARNAKRDGWHLDNVAGFNDTSRYENCWAIANGTIYLTAGISAQYGTRNVVVAGTATITSGSNIVVIAGGPDLTAIPFRKGDILRVGSTKDNSYYGFIESVTAGTFVMQVNSSNLPTQTLAGQQFAIGLGNGLHEERATNNNINRIVGGLWRGNAGVGLRLNGLFGDTVDAITQFDANGFFSISAGDLDNINAVFGLSVYHPYTEVDGVRATFFLGNVVGFQNDTLIGPATDYLPANTPATGTINGADLTSGSQNNFVIQIKNNAGTLQVRFLSDIPQGSGAFRVPSLVATPIAYTNIPTVDAVTGFGAAGCGIVSGFNVLVLDTVSPQSAIDGTAPVERDESGVGHTINLSLGGSNVNGVTMNRFGLLLYDLNGANQPWTSIPAGKAIAIRVNAQIKK